MCFGLEARNKGEEGVVDDYMLCMSSLLDAHSVLLHRIGVGENGVSSTFACVGYINIAPSCASFTRLLIFILTRHSDRYPPATMFLYPYIFFF